jgi:hypothetical protein
MEPIASAELRSAARLFETFGDFTRELHARYGITYTSERGIRGIVRFGDLVVIKHNCVVGCYADDLSDLTQVQYTLEGKRGNQSLLYNQNRHLTGTGPSAIPRERVRCVLVEVTRYDRYKLYGVYKLAGETTAMQHPDKDGRLRTIYRVLLTSA